jgi:transcriptional regulator with XRE-family HTH domain
MENSIGHRIRAWRHALGLTQAAFSERIGVHIGVLKKYEQGLNIPGGEALAAIAKTGVNMNWLLTGEGEMRQETKRLETAPMSRKAQSDGLYEAICPAMPLFAEDSAAALYVRQPRRWQSLIALVEAIDDGARREALINEFFSRAQDAAELADMRRQLAELKNELKKKA